MMEYKGYRAVVEFDHEAEGMSLNAWIAETVERATNRTL